MYADEQIQHFSFQGHNAIVVVPDVPANGRLLLKAEYFDAFPSFEEAMLARGYHICNIEHRNRWAPADEIECTAAFIRYVAETYRLNSRCVPVGMSCGGLLSARLAQTYPELVAALYLDAPVLNILSMLGYGDATCELSIFLEMADAYGFDRSTAVNFRESPIDHMDILLRNKIPIILLYGNADTTVVYRENGAVLADYYRKHGGTIKVIGKSMCGHHPHGLKDPTPIIQFIEENALWD